MLKIPIGTLALALTSLSLAWDRKIIAYYPEYSPSAFNYPVSQVPGNRLDVLNYFYIGDGGAGHTNPIDGNGNLHSNITNSASQLVALKQSYPHLKVMLSIREDADWVTIASDSSKLANFVSQLQTLFAASTAYDGLDIDWEVQDLFGNKAHLASLLQAVRTMMNSQSVILGRPLYLSVAVIAGAPLYSPESYDFNSLDTNCDWLNVMTYDFHTKGADLNQVPHPPTWHAAALNSTTGETVWNVSNQMNRWLVRMRVNNSSYPKKKMMMGVPAAGYLSTGTPSGPGPIYGLGQTSNWVSNFAYRDIVPDLKLGVVPQIDSAAMASTIYKTNGNFYTFDTVSVVGNKAGHVWDPSGTRPDGGDGYGGVFMWHLAADSNESAHDPWSLLQKMDEVLNTSGVTPTNSWTEIGQIVNHSNDRFSWVDSDWVQINGDSSKAVGTDGIELRAIFKVRRLTTPTLTASFRMQTTLARSFPLQVKVYNWSTGAYDLMTSNYNNVQSAWLNLTSSASATNHIAPNGDVKMSLHIKNLSSQSGGGPVAATLNIDKMLMKYEL